MFQWNIVSCLVYDVFHLQILFSLNDFKNNNKKIFIKHLNGCFKIWKDSVQIDMLYANFLD